MSVAGKFLAVFIVLMTFGQGSEWLGYHMGSLLGLIGYIITIILIIVIVGSNGKTNE